VYITHKSPKWWLKKQFLLCFFNKLQFQSNKVCYEVSLCGNFQRQSCNTTIPPSNGPSILAQNVTLQSKI